MPVACQFLSDAAAPEQVAPVAPGENVAAVRPDHQRDGGDLAKEPTGNIFKF